MKSFFRFWFVGYAVFIALSRWFAPLSWQIWMSYVVLMIAYFLLEE
jgi:hypothetical protein